MGIPNNVINIKLESLLVRLARFVCVRVPRVHKLRLVLLFPLFFVFVQDSRASQQKNINPSVSSVGLISNGCNISLRARARAHIPQYHYYSITNEPKTIYRTRLIINLSLEIYLS